MYRSTIPGIVAKVTCGATASGIVFFLLCIPLLRGRWRPRDARRDEAEHEAKVQAELDKLRATV